MPYETYFSKGRQVKGQTCQIFWVTGSPFPNLPKSWQAVSMSSSNSQTADFYSRLARYFWSKYFTPKIEIFSQVECQKWCYFLFFFLRGGGWWSIDICLQSMAIIKSNDIQFKGRGGSVYEGCNIQIICLVLKKDRISHTSLTQMRLTSYWYFWQDLGSLNESVWPHISGFSDLYKTKIMISIKPWRVA